MTGRRYTGVRGRNNDVPMEQNRNFHCKKVIGLHELQTVFNMNWYFVTIINLSKRFQKDSFSMDFVLTF